MKIYVIFAVLFFSPTVLGLYSSWLWNYFLHLDEDNCIYVSKVDEESIETARRDRYLPESPEMNAFAACSIRLYKIMNKDGTINLDVKSYHIPTDKPDITRRVSEKCIILTKVGPDFGDTARRILNCFLQNDQLVIALPSDAPWAPHT